MPNNYDDYILRSDVKKALTALPADLDAETLQRCIEAINNPKAADVERVRHGRWIDENPASPLDPRMRCSVCEHVDVPMWSWRFCPVCGAKMDAEPPKEERDD